MERISAAAPPCDDCGAPVRALWGPAVRRPFLVTVRSGGGMRLSVCPTCHAHWVEVAYDPDGAFVYATLWERAPEDWDALRARGEDALLLRWHRGRVRALYRALPPEERRAVQAHRHRSRGRTPLDGPEEETADLAAALRGGTGGAGPGGSGPN